MSTLALPIDAAATKTTQEPPLPRRQSFLVVDERLRIVHASRGAMSLLGTRPTTAAESSDLIALITNAAECSPASARALERWLDTSTIDFARDSAKPLVLHTREGRSIEASLHELDDRYRVVSFHDATLDRENGGEKVSAFKDHLTGIGNRALFEMTMDEAGTNLEAGLLESAAVFFLDLDRFKIVNDTLGHAVGDDLLRLVSARLSQELDASATLARMGGDEFAILLAPSPGETAVRALAARLIDLLQRTYLIDGHVVHVGASVGIAVAPADGSSRKLLLKRADLALYESKTQGRGLYNFFTAAMEIKAENRRALETDLRKALILRQFEVYYQPQIDVERKTITGLEGLLRWRHPKRGIQLPADFMPLAEEIGITIPIGDWVLKTICNEAKRWPDTVSIAMNVSPHQFERADFADSIQRALTAAGLTGNRLEVELTEDILLRNSPLVASTLQQLHDMGIKVTLDGFGTGVASLSQLVKVSFDKIKIDRSLIALHGGSVRNRAIVRAISALGNTLGITTLAEGVESTEHLAYVQSEGCQSVQGFYYSQAVPATALEELFNQFPPASHTTQPGETA